MSAHFSPSLRAGLLRLRANRERLLSLSEGLPRTVCHLDVWPNNLIRRPSGEVVLLDWAFTGDGALGEDVGNLIPDSVLDLLFPHDALDELDARLTRAYVRGLRDAGSDVDERIVRLGICASAGTPQAIIVTLNRHVVEAVKAPEYRSMIEKAGSLPLSSTPDELSKILADTYEQTAATVREFKLEQD